MRRERTKHKQQAEKFWGVIVYYFVIHKKNILHSENILLKMKYRKIQVTRRFGAFKGKSPQSFSIDNPASGKGLLGKVSKWSNFLERLVYVRLI